MDRELLNRWITEVRNSKYEDLPKTDTEVELLIPHRAPMLLVDRILGVSKDIDTLRATRYLAADDIGFAGHFPNDPVYPGVLQVETISQAGVCLLQMHQNHRSNSCDNDKIRALKLLYAEFLNEIKPDSELELNVKILEEGPYLSTIGGSIRCKNEVCATTIVEVYIGP